MTILVKQTLLVQVISYTGLHQWWEKKYHETVVQTRSPQRYLELYPEKQQDII